MTSKKLTAEQQHLFDALTPLQKRFALAIIKGKNQTDAYKAAKGKAKGDNLRKAAHTIATNCDILAHNKSVQANCPREPINNK